MREYYKNCQGNIDVFLDKKTSEVRHGLLLPGVNDIIFHKRIMTSSYLAIHSYIVGMESEQVTEMSSQAFCNYFVVTSGFINYAFHGLETKVFRRTRTTSIKERLTQGNVD